MSETSELVKPGLAALCKRWPDGVWVRRNVGAVAYKRKKGQKPGFVRFGLPGMADIQGIWHSLAWELEAKLPGEKQDEDQVKWQRAVERAGGVYIVFNDLGDLIQQVDRRWRERVERERSIHAHIDRA